MPTSHDLKGLMKFLAREEWRECFDEVFYDHFGPVLDAGDVDFDEYLKRRGWRENAQAKTYMKALRTSVMSLYEVSEIVPGKSLVARDLIRGGDPVAISEGTATKTLNQWDRIAARIVPLMGKNVFAGGLLPFTPQATDALFDGLRQMFGKKNAKKLPAIKDEELQAAASMFTLSWLFDTLERAAGLPSMQNTDGDELIFHDVRLPLASGVTQKDIAARVSNIPGLSQENAKFWNWLEQKPKHGARKRTGPSFETTMDNGARVLGNIELKGKFLHLSTNSAERAQIGTKLIQQALGDRVRAPLTEIRTVEQMMAERPARDREDPASEIPPEIAAQVVHQFMDRQYRETLDQPVGTLGNETPRQAAKSATGRQKVAEWLKYLENQSSRQPDPADPMATYSFEWMWHELGVVDLRQ
ncbi:hypothetical protein [Rhizobium sp. RAF56]|uniref:hypothetical protein n=1 Tax=Rhizobium sp. RAF56 TaxID=3233062 RepID=UPI003F94D2D5